MIVLFLKKLLLGQVIRVNDLDYVVAVVVVDIYYSDMPEDSNIITWYAYISQCATGSAIVGL